MLQDYVILILMVKKFLKASINGKMLDDKIIEKYAPNVVEGIKKLSNWAKNL